MIVPIIHLNGDRAATLVQQLAHTIDALHVAGSLLAEGAPNGRNYYVQGAGAFDEAVAQFEDRRARILGLIQELTEEMEAIQQQGR